MPGSVFMYDVKAVGGSIELYPSSEFQAALTI